MITRINSKTGRSMAGLGVKRAIVSAIALDKELARPLTVIVVLGGKINLLYSQVLMLRVL